MSRNIPDGFRNAIEETFKELEATEPKKKTGRVVKTTIAVLLCLAVVSVSAVACNELYNKWFKKTGEYSGKLSVEEVSFSQAPDYVKLDFGYMPEGFVPSEPPYKYSYNAEFGLSFNLWKMSSVDTNEYKNIVAVENAVFGTNEGEILTIKDSPAKLALIYFEDMGTVVECYFNKDIPYQQVKAVLDNMSLVEAGEEDALTYDGTNTGTSQPWVDDTNLPVNVCEQAYDYDIATWAKYSVKIVDAYLLDNIRAIDESCMLEDFVCEFTDENGNLKEYQRENVIYGDGVNTLDYVESVETVGRKVVAITYEIENVNDITGEFYCNLVLCDSKLSFIQTESFAVSGQNDESKRFYYVPIEAGEKKTVTVYSVVDDDIDFDDVYVYMQYKNIFEEQTKQDVMKVEF